MRGRLGEEVRDVTRWGVQIVRGLGGHCRDFGFSWEKEPLEDSEQKRVLVFFLAACGAQVGGAGMRGMEIREETPGVSKARGWQLGQGRDCGSGKM